MRLLIILPSSAKMSPLTMTLENAGRSNRAVESTISV
jgi:hypothetical protein